jgi:DedD protein
MAFFVVCLFALGLSFFFGLMTGLSAHPKPPSGPSADASPAPPAESPAGDGAGSQHATSAPASREEGSADPTLAPTAPAVLQAFEDRGAEEPTPAPTAAASKIAAAPAAGAGLWIQVASLTAKGEADALVSRLSRHGYRAQIAAASGPRGKVFRVRVGPYGTEDEARRASEKLRRVEKIGETWIVREGH